MYVTVDVFPVVGAEARFDLESGLWCSSYQQLYTLSTQSCTRLNTIRYKFQSKDSQCYGLFINLIQNL